MTDSYHVTPIAPADCREVLQLRLDVLKGVGPVRAAQLAGRGLATVEDLLYHLPFRYEDRRDVTAVSEAEAGASGSFTGRTDEPQGRPDSRPPPHSHRYADG